VISRIAGIPVVRSIARVIIFGGNNLWAALWKALLPKSQELYLNNVMLAKKLPS
jgi:hypothetical protein